MAPKTSTFFDLKTCLGKSYRHSKQVIIGCGGGFHQECTQPYSPVARWMSEVDIALNDEGQQYGNLDEASAIARVPRKGLVIWCGDHKQTPGGLRKSDEARAFRRKLMRRPIPLRGDTKFLPPHTVGGLGSEGDKTVLLGPKNWNPISSSKCTVLARHG